MRFNKSHYKFNPQLFPPMCTRAIDALVTDDTLSDKEMNGTLSVAVLTLPSTYWPKFVCVIVGRFVKSSCAI